MHTDDSLICCSQELEQTWGTEGAETIWDNLADSNGIAGKDELEENKSTQCTDSGLSEVTEVSFQFQLCPK